MMDQPNITSNMQEEEFNGDDHMDVKRNRFSPYRSEIFNKATLILAKRKILRNSWKWIMINTFFSVLFYIGMYVMELLVSFCQGSFKTCVAEARYSREPGGTGISVIHGYLCNCVESPRYCNLGGVYMKIIWTT